MSTKLIISDEQIQSELNSLGLQHDLIMSDNIDKLALWQECFPNTSPQTLYETLRKCADYGAEIQLQLQPEIYDNKLEYEFIVRQKNEEKDDKFLFALFPEEQNLKLRQAACADNNQGNKVATRYLGSLLEIFKEQGNKDITLTAIGIGAYAWAKFGFIPKTQENWIELKETIKNRIKRKSDGNHAITFNDVYDIQHTYSLPTESHTALIKALNSDNPEDIVHLTELNEVIGTLNGHTITVGKAALLYTLWKGILPLDDNARGYQQFKTYTSETQQEMKNREHLL